MRFGAGGQNCDEFALVFAPGAQTFDGTQHLTATVNRDGRQSANAQMHGKLSADSGRSKPGRGERSFKEFFDFGGKHRHIERFLEHVGIVDDAQQPEAVRGFEQIDVGFLKPHKVAGLLEPDKERMLVRVDVHERLRDGIEFGFSHKKRNPDGRNKERSTTGITRDMSFDGYKLFSTHLDSDSIIQKNGRNYFPPVRKN